MWVQRWKSAALIVLAVLFVLYMASLGLPLEYEVCHPNDYTHAKECADYHFGPGIVAAVIAWADIHNGLVTAFATVGIGIFTLTLWNTSRQQGRIAQASIDLARQEFIASHRPKIIVSGFQMQSDPELRIGEKVEFIFVARNVGDSPARVIEVRSATFVLKEKAPIPSDITFPFKEKFAITLVSQEHELFPGNGGSELEGNEPMEIFGGSKILLCMGTIVYLDESGTRRETGFCRRYRSRNQAWDTISDSQYEYAY
jgi:hypothetical protein